MQLDGKTALLTGATGGLGRAIAQTLAGKGARVLASSRKADELGELTDSLPGEGHRALVCDLAVEGAAEDLLGEAGDVDALVANAALPASGRLDGFSQEEIGRALRVNLDAPIRMARELIPAMEKHGEGHLVFVSSLSGRAATARASLYAATKFGLRGFAFCLRDDLRGSGVGVSVISPGTIRDAGMYADSGAKPKLILGSGTPQQVGDAVIKAIEKDRGEVTVAPLRQRALTRIALNAPELSGRMSYGAAREAGDEIARGQTKKR